MTSFFCAWPGVVTSLWTWLSPSASAQPHAFLISLLLLFTGFYDASVTSIAYKEHAFNFIAFVAWLPTPTQPQNTSPQAPRAAELPQATELVRLSLTPATWRFYLACCSFSLMPLPFKTFYQQLAEDDYGHAGIQGNFSIHSYCIRAATTANAAGLPHSLIRSMGQWLSNTYLTDVRTSHKTLRSIAGQMATTI